MNDSEQLLSLEYGSWLSGLKQQIAVARQKAGIVPQPVAQIP
jgi:hypothetical protein